MIFAGQVIEIVQPPPTVTVTVKELLPTLPLASVAVQFTVVVPRGKLEPDGGVQIGVPTPGQLSETLGGG